MKMLAIISPVFPHFSHNTTQESLHSGADKSHSFIMIDEQKNVVISALLLLMFIYVCEAGSLASA